MKSAYKPDWQLVHKDAEHELFSWSGEIPSRNIIKDKVNFPPLQKYLKRLELEGTRDQGKVEENLPELKRVINKGAANRAILESELETS